MSDLHQAAPERIFERDAGLVAIDHDGAFDDLRFHGAIFWRAIVASAFKVRTTSLDMRSKGRPGNIAPTDRNWRAVVVDQRRQ